MTKTKWIHCLILIFTAAFFFAHTTVPIFADTPTGSVTITKLRNVGKGQSEPVSGSYYALAYVEETLSIVDTSAEILDKEKAAKLLGDLSTLPLNSLQEKAIDGRLYLSDSTDVSGAVTVSGLKAGAYYIVEVARDDNGNWQRNPASVPSLILVEAGRTSTIAIKNQDLPKPDTIEFKIRKVWKGKELTSATVNLKQNGTIVDSVVLSASNNWEHTFINLAKVDSDGNAYTYVAEEEVPNNYTATYEPMSNGSGTIITNTYTPPTPPRKPILKTGTLGIFWLLGIAVILMGLGYRLYRTDKK